jgi:phenylalanyl-tRNA synthetase alpha subunit
MKKSIYEIENTHLQLVSYLIENGGELTPEIETALAINEVELQTKSVAYSFVLKDIDSTIEQIDAELKRLNEIKKRHLKASERLIDTLKNALLIFGVEKIETPLVKISFRNSESVEVNDLALLNKEYTKVSEPVITADKVKIKEAIKKGLTVVGATIVQNKNIQIK